MIDLKTYLQDDLSSAQVDVILKSLSEEESVFLLRFFYSAASQGPGKKPLIDQFIQAVDASPFGLVDWVKSLQIFQVWLQENQKTYEAKAMIGYLGCCAEVAQGKDLSFQLKEFLNSYGVDAAL